MFDASGTSTVPECRRLLAPGGTDLHTLPGAALFGRPWWLKLIGKAPCVTALLCQPTGTYPGACPFRTSQNRANFAKRFALFLPVAKDPRRPDHPGTATRATE